MPSVWRGVVGRSSLIESAQLESAQCRYGADLWNGDLPRPLPQILFQTADAITPELAAIGLLAAAVGLAPQVRH